MVWSERGFIGWFGVRGDLLGGLRENERKEGLVGKIGSEEVLLKDF